MVNAGPMYRTTTSLLTALIAIVFAFGALISVRWPSLIMAGSLIGSEKEVAESLSDINWRQLGVTYGAPYFLAALCFHFSALATSNRRHGAFSWFLMGCAAGFPVAFFVDFEPGWWRAPSLGELTLLNAAALSVLLAWAIWDLRQRDRSQREMPQSEPIFQPVAVTEDEEFEEEAEPAPLPPPRRRRGPVPAAIARQRQLFAEHGRKQLARQRKRMR